MKALLMRSYNKAETVEIYKITKEIIDECKKCSKKLSEYKDDEYVVNQVLIYDEDKLILRENSHQNNDKFEATQNIDIFLKEDDILIKTDLGWKKNLMPIKIITDKEEKLINKYNKIGG